MERMKIKNILVVGGGSSGWMTASALCKYFGDRVNVSVVESSKTGPVGVGESTIIPFNRFLHLVGLKDDEWMRHCNATYKSSIRFTDFSEIGKVFEYPFGGRIDERGMGQWSMFRAYFDDLDHNSFCEYFNDMYFLSKYNRLTRNQDKQLDFDFDKDTAYHFDASLFGKFLKEKICDPAGVEHFVDDIVSVEKDSTGYLTSIIGESGKKYVADLYVDCTGFKSLLLEKEMGSEFISYKPWLLNDRALATKIDYKDKEVELNNVTNCTALSSGWVWNIPLWSRIGTGYVYSSDFISDDDAEKEFKQHLGTDEVEFNKIQIRHGVRKNTWVKNVVGVGLSYGFVEPLESTGLVSTHIVIENLIELLSRKDLNVTAFDKDGFNYSNQQILNGYRDFVALHYRLSSRRDTPYWNYLTEEKDWWEANDNRVYKNSVVSHNVVEDHFYGSLLHYHAFNHAWNPEKEGLVYVLAGMGHIPYGKFLYNKLMETSVKLDREDSEKNLQEIMKQWKSHVRMVEEHVKTLPSTYEFMKTHIYN